MYASMNVGLATAAAALCAFIAPAAAGSGIPEVKAYLNGIDAHSILAPSTLFVKVHIDLTSLLFCVCASMLTHLHTCKIDEHYCEICPS